MLHGGDGDWWSARISRGWLLGHRGVKMLEGPSKFSCRISEHWGHTTQTIAAQLSHSLIMDIPNDVTWWRWQSVVCKYLQQLTFGSQRGKNVGRSIHIFMQNQWATWPWHPNHCCTTVPFTPYGYIEWYCMVQMAIGGLQGSPEAEFWVTEG